MINDLSDKGIEFPRSKKDFSKIEMKNKICINVFCYENKLTYLINVSDKEREVLMDHLISNGNKSYYVYIKYFEIFMFSKKKGKIKNNFAKAAYSVLVIKMYWQSMVKFV